MVTCQANAARIKVLSVMMAAQARRGGCDSLSASVVKSVVAERAKSRTVVGAGSVGTILKSNGVTLIQTMFVLTRRSDAWIGNVRLMIQVDCIRATYSRVRRIPGRSAGGGSAPRTVMVASRLEWWHV